MLSRNFKSYRAIYAVLLIGVFLLGACRAAGLPPNVAENAPENTANVSASADKNAESNTAKIVLPLQTKARRKTIKFPEDCRFSTDQSDPNRQLQIACAEALEDVLPKLPPDENCDYREIQKDNGRFITVVDNPQMLTYTVQEGDIDDLEKLAKKLGTTKLNIIGNNQFKAGKLAVGQELKYQKAHLEKSASGWFENYGIEFYPLSINKYLVKIPCTQGAYNEINAYLMYDESSIPAKTDVLEFPSFEFTHDENSDVAKTIEKTNVKTVGGRFFDPQTKELIVFVKARGIGDAGHYARYSFPNGKPRLSEFRAKFAWTGRGYSTEEILKTPPKTWKRYYPE